MHFSNLCLDVNECMMNTELCNPDIEVCYNTFGSYVCLCVGGYEIGTEGFQCEGISKFYWLTQFTLALLSHPIWLGSLTHLAAFLNNLWKTDLNKDDKHVWKYKFLFT